MSDPAIDCALAAVAVLFGGLLLLYCCFDPGR